MMKVTQKELRNMTRKPYCEDITYGKKDDYQRIMKVEGWLDTVDVADVHKFEERLFEKLENQKPQLLARFEEGYFEDEDIASLEETLTEMTR